MPTEDDFVTRYCERQDEANVLIWQQVTAKGQSARRDWALRQLPLTAYSNLLRLLSLVHLVSRVTLYLTLPLSY
jgi:hypothetical protein